jgi:hypothetical protein
MLIRIRPGWERLRQELEGRKGGDGCALFVLLTLTFSMCTCVFMCEDACICMHVYVVGEACNAFLTAHREMAYQP